jgi:hypothetical protein
VERQGARILPLEAGKCDFKTISEVHGQGSGLKQPPTYTSTAIGRGGGVMQGSGLKQRQHIQVQQSGGEAG